MAYQNRTAGSEAAFLPLLPVVLLSVNAQVGERGKTSVTQVAGVMLGLVVHPHVIGDVSG